MGEGISKPESDAINSILRKIIGLPVHRSWPQVEQDVEKARHEGRCPNVDLSHSGW